MGMWRKVIDLLNGKPLLGFLKENSYVPDEGVSMSLSKDDLSKLVHVLGRPGSGMTFCYMRPITKDWMEHRRQQIQQRWDERRMQRATAPATHSRRPGRL